MYNDQIESLINLAIADGELSEKEKQVLFKKAEAAGIDLDEFEIVLQAKLFEKKKIDAPVAPSSDKLGDIRKCPACGSIAESFATKCGDCNTEFRNIAANQTITKFFEKLSDIESQRGEGKSVTSEEGNITVGTAIKYVIFCWILVPLKLINVVINRSKPPVGWSSIDRKKEELIMNYPIPASREDILEFVTLSESRVSHTTYLNALTEDAKYLQAWNKIWLKKLNQIQTKSSIAMRDDKKTLGQIDNIVAKAQDIVGSNEKRVVHIAIAMGVIITALLTYLTLK